MAINDKTIVNVLNKDKGVVAYEIPELYISRRFTAGESKQLPASELRALSWISGGKSLIKNYLVIDNQELVREILGEVEPEYYYTAEDVEKLLLYGSADQLCDALDFGYAGTASLIKDKAVEIKLNDVNKRNIILEKTGFNVTNAIMHNEESEKTVEETKTRRTAAFDAKAETVKEENSVSRRAASPYKLTLKNDN